MNLSDLAGDEAVLAEAGDSAQLTSLVRIFRELELLAALDELCPISSATIETALLRHAQLSRQRGILEAG